MPRKRATPWREKVVCFLEAPRRSSRLQSQQASTSANLPPPSPPSPPPPHPSSTQTQNLPSPLPIESLHTQVDIYALLQARIVETNPPFLDREEIYRKDGRESSCEDHTKDSFDKGDYRFEEERSLEELWWPEESNYDVYKFNAKNKRRKKIHDRVGGQASGEGGEGLL
ncbi:hypothetical protein KC19_VG238800 [Ceratodon purpureus]|uniref:Uncharacterized protein n=1 Tax=Ceratodon purpureus TaxID=3225 RepID=A0A8T0HTI2_CERPU|nr:hypothetical protein KC19_VG238800 [Ceratodon purpureus]